MAGMQACSRSIILINALRVVNKNSVFQQSNRGRHFLACKVLKNTRFINKSTLLLYSDLKLVSRLASTNVVSNETTKTVSEVSQAENVGKVIDNTINTSSVVKEVPVIDEASLPPVPSVVDPSVLGLKEPTFESLGLCSWWPSGWLQSGLEFLHINMELPWWGAICIVTVLVRTMVIPLNVKAKRNAINMNNHLPELHKRQLKLSEARQSGNYYDAAVCTQELMEFTKEKQIGTMGTMLPALAQAPIFLSVYTCFKGMVNAPVVSMKEGGLFWFQDLTVPDPYYILPVVSAICMWGIIELGAEGVSMNSKMQFWVKNCIRALPAVFLIFTVHFSSAIMWYLTISNSISLLMGVAFRIKFMKKFLNLPEMIHHDPEQFKPKEGSVQKLKDTLTNFRIANELHDRERLNTITFEKAGSGPIPRTFKKDPTKIKTKTAVQ